MSLPWSDKKDVNRIGSPSPMRSTDTIANAIIGSNYRSTSAFEKISTRFNCKSNLGRISNCSRQVIRMRTPSPIVNEVRERVPTPPPDVIFKLTVIPQPRRIVRKVIERPNTPPPIVIERTINETPRVEEVDCKVVEVPHTAGKDYRNVANTSCCEDCAEEELVAKIMGANGGYTNTTTGGYTGTSLGSTSTTGAFNNNLTGTTYNGTNGLNTGRYTSERYTANRYSTIGFGGNGIRRSPLNNQDNTFVRVKTPESRF